MRVVKRNNPGAQVRLDYDKVEVGSKSYVFDYEEGRVVQKNQKSFDSTSSSSLNLSQPFDAREDLEAIEEDKVVENVIHEKQEEIRQLEKDIENRNDEIENLKQMILELNE